MLKYSLKRSKRKTISIQIKNGEVQVYAPNRIALDVIEGFIFSKLPWIEKRIAEFNKKYSAMSDIVTYKTVLYYGNPLKITSFSHTKKPNIINDEFHIPQKNLSDISSVVKNVFRNIAEVELKKHLDLLSKQTGLSYNSFAPTGAKQKWGSCDSKNNILLNWRLIMLEKKLIEYVILHELCHTKEHNHSKKFWSLLSGYLPDYKASQKKLKDLSILTTLY